jgi:nucleotide-binding universal stress UspA family protein
MLNDLTARHQPALFVLGLPAPGQLTSGQVSLAALELLRAAHYPVLLVPADMPIGTPPRKVLVAADREAFALTNTSAILPELLRNWGIELTVAHVSTVEDDAGCAQALRAVQCSGLGAAATSVDLRGYLSSDPADGLLRAIDETEADLVVMLARSRSYLSELFHRSVTSRVINHSPVPVLVVPVAEPASDSSNIYQPIIEDGMLWPEK